MNELAEKMNELAEKMRADERSCPVYCKYDGQQNPQPAAIFIYPEPKIKVDYNGEIGESALEEDYYDLRFAVPIPPNSIGDSIAEWLEDEENQEQIAKMIEGFKLEERNGNKRGLWTYVPEKFLQMQEIETEEIETEEMEEMEE